MQINMVARMDDGTEFDIKADQRDLAKYEQQDFYTENGRFTQMRFVAYNYLRRTGQTKLMWQKWDDTCVEIESKKADAVDPTQQDQPSES